jgi:hypothetical protein
MSVFSRRAEADSARRGRSDDTKEMLAQGDNTGVTGARRCEEENQASREVT